MDLRKRIFMLVRPFLLFRRALLCLSRIEPVARLPLVAHISCSSHRRVFAFGHLVTVAHPPELIQLGSFV
jgi:hypothetical protein